MCLTKHTWSAGINRGLSHKSECKFIDMFNFLYHSRHIVYRRRKQIVWPAESGVHQAHSNGITGEGVLVGCLIPVVMQTMFNFVRSELIFVMFHFTMNLLRDVRGFDVDGHLFVVLSQVNTLELPPDLMVASVIESETYRTSLSALALLWIGCFLNFQQDRRINRLS